MKKCCAWRGEGEGEGGGGGWELDGGDLHWRVRGKHLPLVRKGPGAVRPAPNWAMQQFSSHSSLTPSASRRSAKNTSFKGPRLRSLCLSCSRTALNLPVLVSTSSRSSAPTIQKFVLVFAQACCFAGDGRTLGNISVCKYAVAPWSSFTCTQRPITGGQCCWVRGSDDREERRGDAQEEKRGGQLQFAGGAAWLGQMKGRR